MDPSVRSALISLNRAFYARFAVDFARTRSGWPAGFDRILPYLGRAANVLDLGCGNGRLLTFLAKHGWTGQYLGADSSKELLALAEQAALALPANAMGIDALFEVVDFADPGWISRFRTPAFDAIAALAVLHHIPGRAQRIEFLAACRTLLGPRGLLVVSTWQFLAAPRLRARILPWQVVGLGEADVETGDYLLSWGEGAAGQRYCAAIDEDELAREAAQAGLSIGETFRADGREGNLNLYAAIWKVSPV
jgi:tRNA (uracil-5-)-methyltransferase TRM9